MDPPQLWATVAAWLDMDDVPLGNIACRSDATWHGLTLPSVTADDLVPRVGHGPRAPSRRRGAAPEWRRRGAALAQGTCYSPPALHRESECSFAAVPLVSAKGLSHCW
jgi:hypothetical protein